MVGTSNKHYIIQINPIHSLSEEDKHCGKKKILEQGKENGEGWRGRAATLDRVVQCGYH